MKKRLKHIFASSFFSSLEFIVVEAYLNNLNILFLNVNQLWLWNCRR